VDKALWMPQVVGRHVRQQQLVGTRD